MRFLVTSMNSSLQFLQVLKESFHPRFAPRVRVWLNEATAEGW